MLVLSLAIIPLLLIPLIWELSPGLDTTFLTIDWFIWAAFVIEYGARLYLAPAKWGFVKRNKIDLLVIVLPFLRPLRVVRSARALGVLRAARVVSFIGRGFDAGRDVLTRHKLHYACRWQPGPLIGGQVALVVAPSGKLGFDTSRSARLAHEYRQRPRVSGATRTFDPHRPEPWRP
jgi:hypothetical protein